MQKSLTAMLAVVVMGFVALATAAGEPTERFVAYAVDYMPVGQVWRVGLDGSGAQQLTSGETADVSPDGVHIAFIRDSGLYVMNADGSAIRRLRDFGYFNGGRDAPSILWAPDSRRVAVQDAEGPIWLVDTRSGSTRKLVHRINDCCLGLTGFAPRGCELVYEVYNVGSNADPFRVRTVRCDGSHGRTVGTTYGGAAWGNAGIVVSHRNELTIIKADGSSRRLARAGPYPKVFSSDGRMLLADGGDRVSIIEVATGRTRVVKAVGEPLAISHDGTSVLELVGCIQDRVPSATLEVQSIDSGTTRVIADEDPAHGRYGPCRASWNA